MSNISKSEHIFTNINFEGFWQQAQSIIKDAIENYWETEAAVTLLALNDFKNVRDEHLIKNTDFFSSQIRVEHHKPVIIRLDDVFIKNFLDISLNTKGEEFVLRQLTPLEVKIFNNFCEFLYRQLNEILIPPKQAKISPKSEKNINLIMLAASNKPECAKIMFSIPQDRIDMAELEHQTSFRDEDFIHSTAYVKIRVGYSKLTLEELNNLAADDIILLEDSNLNTLTLISGGLEKNFKVEVNESLITKIDNDDEDDDEEDENSRNNIREVTMEKNLWDDIQIELSAEFSKVKMTIGELKQITRGQIVDLGSVFNNEISLYIENKKVAKGELLIINDKYAVRLNEVLNSNVTAAQAPAPQQAPKPAPANPQPQQKAPAAPPPRPQGAPPPRPQGARPAPPPPRPQGAPPPRPQAAPPRPQSAPKKPVEDEEFDYSDFEN